MTTTPRSAAPRLIVLVAEDEENVRRMIGLVQIGLGLSDSTLQTIQLGIDGDLRVQMPDPGGKWGVRAKTADLPQFHTTDGLAA